MPERTPWSKVIDTVRLADRLQIELVELAKGLERLTLRVEMLETAAKSRPTADDR